MARTMARFWSGTAETALKLLRAEYDYVVTDRASRLATGEGIRRGENHRRYMDSFAGLDYGFKLGILVAAAPESSRRAILDAFPRVLGTEDAATMRGVAAGEEHLIDVRFYGADSYIVRDALYLDMTTENGRLRGFERRAYMDDRGAARARASRRGARSTCRSGTTRSKKRRSHS